MTTPRATQGRVALRKDLTRSILGGHPWIYRDALATDRAIPDGAIVLVTTRAGTPLGRGIWSSASPIAVRMLTTDAAVEIDAAVRERLRRALERRLGLLDPRVTSAFRWVHGEADGLPGMHLDVYGTCASARFDGADAATFYQPFGDEILALGAPLGLTCLVERRRGPRGGGAGALEASTEPPDAAASTLNVLAGVAPPRPTILVRENGLAFEVDLLHGQKGGLFLDQRDNRAWVRDRARGRRVLNLFGYTGGFSIYAAAGGARETTTVDVAAGAIASARRNFEHNALPLGEAAHLSRSDVFAFLASAQQRRQSWQLVISDPPSFAPSRHALPEARRAYRRLHQTCAAMTTPGGLLCAASCSSHVTAAMLIESVAAGCAQAGRRFELQEVRGAGADHPVIPQFPEGDYLKFVAGIVR